MATSSGKKKSKTTKKAAGGRASTARSGGSKGAAAKPSASKKTAARKTSKAPAAGKSASSKPAGKKPSAKKPAGKKSSAKAPASKSSAKKPTSKTPATKKSVAKKVAPKKADAAKSSKSSAAKPATKQASSVKKAPAGKPAVKKTPATKSSKKADGKPAAGKVPASKPAAESKPSVSPAAAAEADKKSGRKGITIVSKRPQRKTKPKPARPTFTPPGERLLGPGAPVRKPLIPSGPSVSQDNPLDDAGGERPKKSPFKKRELDKYRKLLLTKRAEVLGDVTQMESDALRSESGNLSHTPQHMADQGSDSYEQSLSLDLVAADRRLIKEIDDALQRIDEGVYGLCERTGRPITVARLDELPWARYSIEAARELERRGGF